MRDAPSMSSLLQPVCRWSVNENCGALVLEEFQGEVSRVFTLIRGQLDFIDPSDLQMVALEACLDVVTEEEAGEAQSTIARVSTQTGRPEAPGEAYVATKHKSAAEKAKKTVKALEVIDELLEDGTIPQYEVFGVDAYEGRKVAPKALVEWWFLNLCSGKNVDELKADPMANSEQTDELYQANLKAYQQEVEQQQEARANEEAEEERMLEYDRLAARHNQRMAYIRQKIADRRQGMDNER